MNTKLIKKTAELLSLSFLLTFATTAFLSAAVATKTIDKHETESATRFHSIEKAAHGGNTESQFQLGVLFLTGTDTPKDLQQAVYWLKKAADHKHPAALYELGVMHEKGIGVEKSRDEALFLYQQAAVLGFAHAQYRLGKLHSEGEKDLDTVEQALHWLEKAAANNHLPAKKALRQFNQKITHTAKDWTADAQCGIGTLYEKIGGYREATKWYASAAEKGSVSAHYNLAVISLNGRGVPRDYKKAYEHFKVAAEAGHPQAQYNLGVMCQNGMGVRKSLSEADRWFTAAAKAGIDGDLQ